MEKKNLDKPTECNTIVYTLRWNSTKSERLKRTRGVSFEEIIQSDLLGIIDNSSRPNQKNLMYRYKGYVWVVPFIYEAKGIFLKTIYPSRKFKKIYNKRSNNEKNKID